MSLHVFWPATCALTFVVLGVILLILKHGPRLCKTRHVTLTTDSDWEDKAFEQKVSYA